MKRIPLTQGKEAIVDDEDHEYLMQWKWCARRSGRCFHARRVLHRQGGKQKFVYMHAEVANRAGLLGHQVDHQDRNGLNNQRSNLRLATPLQNSLNRGLRQNNTSGATGVSWMRSCQKWAVDVSLAGRRFRRRFDDFNEAVAWRDAKARELHGEFAYLNGAA